MPNQLKGELKIVIPYFRIKNPNPEIKTFPRWGI
jgi:hypothetical protein